jgi:glutamine synthetase
MKRRSAAGGSVMLTVDELAPAGFHAVMIAAPDVQGRPVGRQVPVARFREQPDEGVEVSSYALVYDLVGIPLFDAPFAGPHTGYHDIRLRPDLATLRQYPALPGVALCLADAVDHNDREIAVSPRAILRRQEAAARSQGFDLQLATELEFYLFADDVRQARAKGFRALEPTTPARSTYGIDATASRESFLRPLAAAMAAAGIPVTGAQAEAGRGQWEANLRHISPLAAADNHLAFKLGVKELARQAGMTATFMARPVADDLGSSCHIHVSLWRDGCPLFPAEPGAGTLSDVGRHFAGGLLAHLAATAIWFAPYANSYKRHAPGFAAGGVVAWGEDNRAVAVRAVGHGETLRLEHRHPGADANPYLAIAAVIAAGLEGIAVGRDPGPPVAGDADARADLARSPASLGDALRAFTASSFVETAFGSEIVAHYAAHARAEWSAWLTAVTDWELSRGFEAV